MQDDHLHVHLAGKHSDMFLLISMRLLGLKRDFPNQAYYVGIGDY